MILNAITNSFTDLLEPAHAGASAAAIAAIAAEGDKGLLTDDPDSGGDEWRPIGAGGPVRLGSTYF
jgi:hypothetical protein